MRVHPTHLQTLFRIQSPARSLLPFNSQFSVDSQLPFKRQPPGHQAAPSILKQLLRAPPHAGPPSLPAKLPTLSKVNPHLPSCQPFQKSTHWAGGCSALSQRGFGQSPGGMRAHFDPVEDHQGFRAGSYTHQPLSFPNMATKTAKINMTSMTQLCSNALVLLKQDHQGFRAVIDSGGVPREKKEHLSIVIYQQVY